MLFATKDLKDKVCGEVRPSERKESVGLVEFVGYESVRFTKQLAHVCPNEAPWKCTKIDSVRRRRPSEAPYSLSRS